jgi:DNA-binding beta-propeller fold protein YncE
MVMHNHTKSIGLLGFGVISSLIFIGLPVGGGLTSVNDTSTQIKNISSNQSNFAVLKFDKDGKFIKGWGSEGLGEGEFLHPHGLTVDSSDNVYVTDQKNCNVQKFTNDGKFITSWLLEASNVTKCGTVESLAVDPSGNVYVASLGH